MADEGAEIVDLDARRPIWANSLALCVACSYRWVATWPAGAPEAKPYDWECPRCHEKKGAEIQRFD